MARTTRPGTLNWQENQRLRGRRAPNPAFPSKDKNSPPAPLQSGPHARRLCGRAPTSRPRAPPRDGAAGASAGQRFAPAGMQRAAPNAERLLRSPAGWGADHGGRTAPRQRAWPRKRARSRAHAAERGAVFLLSPLGLGLGLGEGEGNSRLEQLPL